MNRGGQSTINSIHHNLLAMALLCALGGMFAGESEKDGVSLARTLTFSDERVAGWLYLRPWGADDDAGWTRFREAWGEVEIPQGHEVKLETHSVNLKLLGRLKSGDLQTLSYSSAAFGAVQGSDIAGIEGLKRLELSTQRIDSNGIGFLAQMKSLHVLDISRTPASDTALLELSALPSLQAIELPPGITDRGMKGVGEMIRLERLDLTRLQQVTDAGLELVGGLTQLRELKLPPKTTDVGLQPLRGLKELRRLSLERTQVTDEGLAQLAVLSALESLDCSLTQITGDGLSRLIPIKSLKRIRMYGSKVTDAALARLDDLPSLEVLELGHTAVTDSGMRHVGELRHVKRLDLSYTGVGSEGVALLRGASTLEELDLEGTKVTDDGLPHLKEMRSLRLLLLPMQVSRPEVEKLQRMLPDCKIPMDGRFSESPAAPASVGGDPIS